MILNDKELELIKIALTFLAWISVVIGWVVTDYLTKRRDVESQKRKIRTEYLVNAFRFLATSVSNRNLSELEEDWKNSRISFLTSSFLVRPDKYSCQKK
jgi:hypothetical protein